MFKVPDWSMINNPYYYKSRDSERLIITVGDSWTYGDSLGKTKVRNGIATGTGDGYTNIMFNNAINSWQGTGFVDTCYGKCYASIIHRNGNFVTFGIVSSGNSMYSDCWYKWSGI